MSHDLRSSFALHGLVVVAGLAAATALLGAVLSDSSPGVLIAWWLAIVALTVSSAIWWRRRFRRVDVTPAVSPIVMLLFVLPFLVEATRRMLAGPANPLEIVLICAVLLAGLSLSAAGGCVIFQPLAMTCHLFATLFAASLSSEVVTCLGVVGFVGCGASWLAVRHWSTLLRRSPRRTSRRPYPVRAVVIGMLLLTGPLAAVGWMGSDRMWALSGWAPSSGGDGASDPSARNGIGNGEALVAGEEDIQSFGPIEEAPFRSSDDPSLYDLFNEAYDEPLQNQRQDRAIPLPPSLTQAVETRMAKSQRAAKEFSTARKSRERQRSAMNDLTSTALFYVKGRTPLHLRHEILDLFDGRVWYAADTTDSDPQPVLNLMPQHGRSWVRWSHSSVDPEYLAAEESHALKIVRLQSNRLPTPLHLRGVHLDHLNETDLFLWDGPELLRMDRDNLPELTAIHLRSRTIDHRRLPGEGYWGTTRDPLQSALPLGDDLDRIRALAESWTAGIPRGWPQIEAIVARLRRDYLHDHEARPPEDVLCPVAHFLFESRCGPDYQFATATAVMLRTLGYSTRLVAGFYASPHRYDAPRRHTAVVADDTHVWVEVFHRGRTWITIEPTPGYNLLGPPPTWWEEIQQAVVLGITWLATKWLLVLAGAGMSAIVWRGRNLIRDRLVVAWWRIWPTTDRRQCVLRAVRVIDERLRLRRQPRPCGCSPLDWYERIRLPPNTDRQPLRQLAELADWAAYAPADVPSTPARGQETEDLCRRAVATVAPPAWNF